MSAREIAERFLQEADSRETLGAPPRPLAVALGIGWALLAIADRLGSPAAPPEEEPEPEIPSRPRFLGDTATEEE